MIDHSITVENLMRVFPLAFLEDDRLQALGKAIAEELVRREAEARLCVLYADIDSLPENVLDILAYDFKVDWWDTSYTPEEKRRTLKNSWKVHRMMGTKAAVEMAISAIYPNTTVEEWFEYGGKPYHFKLTIDATRTLVDMARHEKVLGRANYYKNLRSHLECITYITDMGEEPLRFGGLAGSIMRTPMPELDDRYDFEQLLRLGGQLGGRSRARIGEEADRFGFPDDTLRFGGSGGTRSSAQVSEATDRFGFPDQTLRLGGRGATRSRAGVAERSDTFRFASVVRAGAQAGAQSKTPIKEQPDQFRFADNIAAAGQGGSIVKSPVLEH